MAVYHYTTKDEKTTVARQYPMATAPKKVRVNGEWAYRNIAADHQGGRTSTTTYPYFSDSCGVGHDQIGEAIELDKKLGVHADYRRDGCIKFETVAHRKTWCEAHGFYDKDAGYGDPQRR